jgi:RNA polymerase sigma-B factor
MSLDAPVTAAEPDDPDTLMDTVGRNDDGFGLVEATTSLSAAIARLPYCERQVLTLRLRGDLKQSEIAAELGCSQMQVSRLLRRAAERIREMTPLPC